MIHKNTRQLNTLKHVLVGKVDPLFRDMLEADGAMTYPPICGKEAKIAFSAAAGKLWGKL